jgi:hypothetical protein
MTKLRPIDFVLSYVGCALVLLAVFRGSFGIPNYGGDLCFAGGNACYYIVWRSWYRHVQATPGVISLYSQTVYRWIGPGFALASLGFLVFSVVDMCRR